MVAEPWWKDRSSPQPPGEDRVTSRQLKAGSPVEAVECIAIEIGVER
jgi:hypothetical protein